MTKGASSQKSGSIAYVTVLQDVQPKGKQNIYQSYLDFEQTYIPRGTNVLQCIFKDHFSKFKEQYDEKYAKTYGKYRIERITEVVEEFIKCGDYKEGLARIKCQNS